MSRIPTWTERLAACFQWRHRFLHVFGAPAAVGAVTAAAAADWLTTTSGLGLGALVAGVGTLLAGYYVVSGFDHALVEQLQAEHAENATLEQAAMNQSLLQQTSPEVRAVLERILADHQFLEHTFDDGIDDKVEAILLGSRPDLEALRARALRLVQLYNQLSNVLGQSNVHFLQGELLRVDRELSTRPSDGVRAALTQAKESTQAALERYQNTIDKQRQVRSVLTVIEASLRDFRVAMELRKADAVLSDSAATPNVTELQSRLVAAGDACDELMGQRARRSRGKAKARS